MPIGWAQGHFYTVFDNLRDRARPPRPRESVEFVTHVADPARGLVPLSGAFTQVAQSDTVILIVHGLGGSADSGYVIRFANAAHDRGFSTLRLHLRGADRLGHGVYHAGLTADILTALASPELCAYARRFVVGFSMGGHVSLRALHEQATAADALVSICAPLDLSASADHIDHPLRTVYRSHVLSGLKEIYCAYARKRGLEREAARAKKIRRLRDWDEHVIAPHFGFAGAADYYEKVSAGPILPELACKTLVIASDRDPMVPRSILEPHLAKRSEAVAVLWERGGHVGFAAGSSLWQRILDWLENPSPN
jgi:predicted alpha/beta-fold hydrolase